MDSNATRPSLLARLRDYNDEAAWREFDARYRELILRYCRARGLQISDAEDVRQTVFMSLASSLKTFHYSPERGRFHCYLGRVVGNAIKRYLASKQRIPVNVAPRSVEDAGGEESALDELWEREWIDHHYRIAYERLRDTLEPRSIAVFSKIVAGDTVDTVARAFDMTNEAVQKVKQRVRARLEELIAAQIRDEDAETIVHS